jgi:hypothetical protein
MSQVSRTTYTFEVLHPSDVVLHGIDHAMREAWDGCAVGNVTSEVTTPVPADQVADALFALGNDGTFFQDDHEEEA